MPTAVRYQSELIESAKGLREIFSEKEFKEIASDALNLIREISEHTSYIKAKVNEMIEARKAANKIEDVREKAMAYATKYSRT